MEPIRKRLIIFGAALLVLAGAYFGAVSYNKAKNPREYVSSSVQMSDFKAADINRVEVPEQRLALIRENGPAGETWVLESGEYKLDQEAVKTAVRNLVNMRADRVVEEDSANLGNYGLVRPSAHVILYAGGKKLEYFAGIQTPAKTGYYVQKAGDPRIYAVSGVFVQGLFLTKARLRDRSLFPVFELDKLKRVAVIGPGRHLEIAPRRDDQLVYAPLSLYMMDSPYRIPRGVDLDALDPVLKPLSGSTVVDFVDPAPAASRLAEYGLDKPSRFILETQDGKSIELLLGKSEGMAQYAQLPGKSEVFLADDLSALVSGSLFNYVDKFALLVLIDWVKSFTVKASGRPGLSARIEGPSDGAKYFLNDKEVTEKSFKQFYQAVIGLAADAEMPPDSGITPGPVDFTISYELNREPGKMSVTLRPWNRDFYCLDQNGATDFLISRAQVDKIYTAAEKVEYIR